MITKSAFFKGAIILAVSNVIVKLIGAFYTIPLARLIGAEGIGLYSSAYQSYLWFFILSTTGFPIAISKLVSENIALSKEDEAHRVFKISFFLLFCIGLFSSIFLYFSASALVKVIGASEAYLPLVAITPSLFFISLSSAYRGYFQGMQDMIPTAVSQLIEAIIKVAVGLTVAFLLLGFGLEYSSAGAAIGVSSATLGGTILLICTYFSKKKQIIRKVKMSSKNKSANNSLRSIVLNLIKISFPITLGASIFAISSIIDLIMIIRRLKDIGFSESYAIMLYGYLTGYAYKIYTLPATVVIALAISIVPIISGMYARKNTNQSKRIINISIKWALLFSIPSAVGMCILSEQILKLLFNDINATMMLQILSGAIVFVTVVQVSSSILQGIGKEMLPVKNLIIGAVLKIIANYILLGIPQVNILGAAIGTTICYIVVTFLNLKDISKIFKIKYDLNEIFFKPLIGSIGMGIAVIYSYNYVFSYIHRNSLSTLICVGIGAIVYLIIILLIGGLNKEDIELMPFKSKAFNGLLNLKIIKNS